MKCLSPSPFRIDELNNNKGNHPNDDMWECYQGCETITISTYLVLLLAPSHIEQARVKIKSRDKATNNKYSEKSVHQYRNEKVSDNNNTYIGIIDQAHLRVIRTIRSVLESCRGKADGRDGSGAHWVLRILDLEFILRERSSGRCVKERRQGFHCANKE